MWSCALFETALADLKSNIPLLHLNGYSVGITSRLRMQRKLLLELELAQKHSGVLRTFSLGMVLDIDRVILLEIGAQISKLRPLQIALSIAYPSLRKQRRVEQIVVIDVKTGSVKLQSDETVVADVDVFVGRILPVVIQHAITLSNIWSSAAANRHSAMANAAPKCLDAIACTETVVESKAVFVAPEPEHRTIRRNHAPELLSWYRIPIVKTRIVFMVR